MLYFLVVIIAAANHPLPLLLLSQTNITGSVQNITFCEPEASCVSLEKATCHQVMTEQGQMPSSQSVCFSTRPSVYTFLSVSYYHHSEAGGHLPGRVCNHK